MAVAMMIVRNVEHAIEIGRRMGWNRIAAMRFATQAKDDVRAATKVGDMIALPPKSVVYLESDFDTYPNAESLEKEILAREWEPVELPAKLPVPMEG